MPNWPRESSLYDIKSFKSLKQAGKLWNKTITKSFGKIGFIPTNADTCIFTIKKKGELIIVG